ncbi:MAG: penicillin acylase family protein [Gammaproteobacteria bacterium]|nr:penicillin acylase family protein [Gammaproteobacteria bacterium]
MKKIRRLLLLAVLLPAGAFLAGWAALHGSLPQIDGSVELAGLKSRVTVKRDRLGVPELSAWSLDDMTRAMGFLHAQERFFQMDLLRRTAAGELSELVGGRALDHDRSMRIHRLRHVAGQIVAGQKADDRRLLEAYTDGVNAGLDALAVSPFEYLLLRQPPRPWIPEDSLLVVLAMYADLQDENANADAERGYLQSVLPASMYRFLFPVGSQWDAPLMGTTIDPSLPPLADVYDLRSIAEANQDTNSAVPDYEPEMAAGSNNWALAGHRTAHGGGLLANDMHLRQRVPAIWYRARLKVANVRGRNLDVTGVTLPGTPLLIAGSNGRVAWAYTNSNGDWTDRVILESHPEDDGRYLTPDGYRDLVNHREVIRVKGGEDVVLEVRSSRWGPVIGRDRQGRLQAVHWLAAMPEATNMRLLEMMFADNVHEALRIAPEIGMPQLNLVVADADGNIGWTIIGKIPRRAGGFDPSLPASWARSGTGWDGWLSAAEYPRVINPASGQIWTANSRTVGEPELTLIGDGGYALGARSTQIRDDLSTLQNATPGDFLLVQLDDRAVFLDRWRRLALDLLAFPGTKQTAQRQLAANVLADDDLRASTDSQAYLLVREFRKLCANRLRRFLTLEARRADPDYQPHLSRKFEGALWQLVEQRPRHLLDPQYDSWPDFLLAALDDSVTKLDPDRDGQLETWGDYNVVRINHPLGAIPGLGEYLNIPPHAAAGDTFMPRVQTASFGASERFAVAPGREAEGYFHMPGGQSGHPLSAYYRAGFRAWAMGEPLPFLPGEPVHTLQLVPISEN